MILRVRNLFGKKKKISPMILVKKIGIEQDIRVQCLKKTNNKKKTSNICPPANLFLNRIFYKGKEVILTFC